MWENGLLAQSRKNYQGQPCILTSYHQGLHSCCPPHPLSPCGEAYLLLDGIQDAPHVLIHLQALQQSGFTGKGERWDLALAAGP